ncbi:unnamed protein product [Rotaria sordida]|uniref:Uncharacterized protein n=1 Tax=Rotaria sordida TaxID=392033 RepID=A0A815QPN0_9BILA|nr:unnamed protein product [Rotaria sordida]CAF1643354.1 unnamed protein product [Rotaria sordida]
MTSTQQTGVPFERIRGSPGFNVNNLECSICHELLWKPVACRTCETPFCSTCINQWLINHPNQCPNQCQIFAERKCPPFIVKLLSQLQIACFYQSTGCNEIISYEGLDKHEIECNFQSQQCPGCQLQIIKEDFDNHISNCTSIELTCQDCKIVYKRGDADRKHTENICLKEQLRQLRDEYKENKREMHELTLQLHEMRLLNPLIKKIRITFDDLDGTLDKLSCISAEYRGLKWTGISSMHKSKKIFPLFRQRNQIVSLDRKEFIEIKLIEIAALADKCDTSKHQQ